MYQVGWAKQEILIEPKGFAMFGYGHWKHRAYQKKTALFARTVCIQSDSDTPLIFCCLDLGCITDAIRSQTVERLQQKLSNRFKNEHLVLTATHTHSGPGGCSYEALYNMPTPGFVPEHLAAVTQAIELSVVEALECMQETEIRHAEIEIPAQIPVAWNRSINSYNRNVDTTFVDENNTHLALNRHMQVMGFYRRGQLNSFISLFGVHATCLGNTLDAHDGDNKGYAASFSEQQLHQQGIDHPVCIFAQATAGDVSPHFHGKNQVKIRKKIKGEAEYVYAQQNGRYQAENAFLALEQSENQTLELGKVDAVYEYVDLANVKISEEFSAGQKDAQTSIACHGTAFIAGTPVDGVGAAKPLVMAVNVLTNQFKKAKLNSKDPVEREYYQKLYASQGPKNIIFESGNHRILGKKIGQLPGVLDPLIAEMNAQVKAGAIQKSELVPHIIPLQILKIGSILIVCAPGEFTTTAGNRVMNTIRKDLSSNGEHQQVWFTSYCNDYMGYVTTYEEYQEQAYEGGHTLFGQWTLAAFQMHFKQLAHQINLEPSQRKISALVPEPVPMQELEKRTNHGNIKTAVTTKE